MAVKLVIIEADHATQRIDNYLQSACKGVPKTRLYRAIRKGEVRVNKKRVKPDYRLVLGDTVRIPPIRMAPPKPPAVVPARLVSQIEQGILLENNDYILIDKPSGIPVHGGTGIKTGLIEAIRELRPNAKFMELVHRLDRDTSGCLLIAKKRGVLVKLHELLLHKKFKKHYLALVRGQWQGGIRRVNAPLKKNHLASGERIVVVSDEGKDSVTEFRLLQQYKDAALVEAIPVTGRTHQIRVHAAHIGHPIAGDEKYGDDKFTKKMKAAGLRRLFLHSASIYCRLSDDPDTFIGLCAPLDSSLRAVLRNLSD